MQRWEFKAGCILMGWSTMEAAIELGTSCGTIMNLEDGDLDETLEGKTIELASQIFKRNGLAIRPQETQT